MSAYPQVKALYEQQCKERGCNPKDGLPIGAWAEIIREGISGWDASDQDIANAFLQMDKDKSNTLTWEEFYDQMAKPKLDDAKKAEVEKLFKKWDKTGDSKLNREEMEQVMSDYRPACLDKVIKEADKDKDGLISVKEFMTIVFGC